MVTIDLHNDYLNNHCTEVWRKISFLDYDELTESEREIVDKIISEVLLRIFSNALMVLDVLKKHNYRFVNFGNINTTSLQYSLNNELEKSDRARNLLKPIESNKRVPYFFVKFCSVFKVLDFRGEFDGDINKFLLDPLFIESFVNETEIEYLTFNVDYQEDEVEGCMFSPDEYVKDDVSGDIGPCILLSEKLYIDNYVLNYDDDFTSHSWNTCDSVLIGPVFQVCIGYQTRKGFHLSRF